MSKGVEIIGKFNVSSNQHVDLIKAKSAELIDLILENGKSERRNKIAVDLIEQAQMMGVKSIFSEE